MTQSCIFGTMKETLFTTVNKTDFAFDMHNLGRPHASATVAIKMLFVYGQVWFVWSTLNTRGLREERKEQKLLAVSYNAQLY